MITGASYHDHGVLHAVLGVVAALAAIVLIIVCVVHRRRKRAKRKQKAAAHAQQLRGSASGGGRHVEPGDGAVDTTPINALGDGMTLSRGGPMCNNSDKDAPVEVRYVSRTSATPNAAAMATNAAAMTSLSSSPVGHSNAGTGTANRRLLKEKTEKVSIV